ncbi:transcription elongation factor A N-terminal and central domain-containing protein [Diretmus argenteus]
MDTKQIAHYAVQIEKLNVDRSYDSIMTLLGDLEKSCVAVEQLQATGIVQVLYRLLKTCCDDGVKKTAKRLLSDWKRRFYHSHHAPQGTGSSEDGKDAGLSDGDAHDKAVSKQGVSHWSTCEGGGEGGTSSVGLDGQSAASSTFHSLSDERKPHTSTADGASASSDFSAVRSKCVHLILGALCCEAHDASGHDEKAAELAGDIEQHVHRFHGANQVKYKTCVRSKVANLRNPGSRHLRLGLLSGSLSPEAFARMSAEEMAGVELRRQREEYSSRGVSERQLPQGVEGTPTQKIRCKRCEGSDCRVTQVSRGTLFLPAWVRQGGPDEDAMTFVTCGGCGEQWYHSGWVCL